MVALFFQTGCTGNVVVRSGFASTSSLAGKYRTL